MLTNATLHYYTVVVENRLYYEDIFLTITQILHIPKKEFMAIFDFVEISFRYTPLISLLISAILA